MKTLINLALAFALAIGLTTTALADTNLGDFRHDPMSAIEAGDALGLEIIPRSELEEVRGEALWALVMIAGPIAYDVYFNQGKGSIRTTALVLQRMGYPGMVKKLERMGIL